MGMSGVVCFLGFGEAAQTFAGAAGWRSPARGYDIKTDIADLAAAKLADFARCGASASPTVADAVKDAGLVLSLVTADQALEAAHAAAAHIASGVLYFDMNSVAPATKQAAASAIEGRGGRYVDVAVMSPVRPAALATPLLVSGPHADLAMMALRALGFTSVAAAGAEVGRASLIKMVRSVLIKSVEAVSAECLLAAHAAGVVDEVLDSLGPEWAARLDYNLERVLDHGERRAAEMEEAAHTLRDLGIDPVMTAGAILRQRELGALGLGGVAAALLEKLDRIAAVKKAALA
jgi:3-hydroxyisobutyrate dehydrogenase-like beta-hydroxyacid dehydrogenase